MAGNGKKVTALPDSGGDIPSKEYMGVFQAVREGLYFQAGQAVDRENGAAVLGKRDRAEDDMGILHGLPEGEGGKFVIVKESFMAGLIQKPVQANLSGISAQYEDWMHGYAPYEIGFIMSLYDKRK